MDKYELIYVGIEHFDLRALWATSDKARLFRVRALRDFADVKAGDVGGFVENPHNLSQYGDCWIYNDAVILGERSHLFGNAVMRDNAMLSGGAQAGGRAEMSGFAHLEGIGGRLDSDAKMSEHAHGIDSFITGKSCIAGNAQIERSVVETTGVIDDCACIKDGAIIVGNVKATGSVCVCGQVLISGDVTLRGAFKIGGECMIHPVDGYIAYIASYHDYITISPISPYMSSSLTFYLSSGRQILVSCAAMDGTLEQFYQYIEAHSSFNDAEKKAFRNAAELAKIHLLEAKGLVKDEN